MVHKSKWLPLSLDVGDLYYELPVDMVTNTFLGRQKGAHSINLWVPRIYIADINMLHVGARYNY